METDTGLEAEASSNSTNACVSSQAGPSPELALFSTRFLHSLGAEEATIQNRGLHMGVYFVNAIFLRALCTCRSG